MTERDVIWSLYNKLILKYINDFNKLSSIYYEMALFLKNEGRNPYDMRCQSTKIELQSMKQKGIKRVRWISSLGERTCKEYRKMNDKVFAIDNAIKEMPLPLKDCKNTDEGKYGFCRCTWIAVD